MTEPMTMRTKPMTLSLSFRGRIGRLMTALGVGAAAVAYAGDAAAQEIQLTGPLAGAPAVRHLRLHRKQRFELAPTVSFTLLDEFQRTILVGARLNYNVTDWLAFGAWGAFGAVHTTTGLTDKIQASNQKRFSSTPCPGGGTAPCTDQEITGRTLVRKNIGKDFTKQLGKIGWVLAPQITAVPFRGKLAIFQKVFVDTDAYLFAGPAFVGLTERANCVTECDKRENPDDPYGIAATKPTASRVATSATFGLGLTFYTSGWTSFGIEWRALPFAWNTAGFDNAGGGEGARFPDQRIDEKDREFKFNQMITLSLGLQFPRTIKQSE